MTWTPSAAWNREFVRALDEAFDAPSMELLTADYFPLGYRFSKIAPGGLNIQFVHQLNQLINVARMDDWLVDLVSAARERRPKNPRIRAIADELGLTIAGPRFDNATRKPFEEIIRDNAKFINVASFLEKLPLLEGQVCWVDIASGGGTGFLVGPDLVLTNFHVIERVKAGQVPWQQVNCRFDYKQAIDGTTLDRKKKTEVPLHTQKWLVDFLPPSQFDWNPSIGNPTAGELDYALIRLAEKVGDHPVGGDTTDLMAQPRGWIDTGTVPSPPIAGNQVILLQHPKGEPLQLTIGTVTEFNNNGTRLRYDANSKDGSSGSPCFNVDLQLVGLHHARDPASPPKWNQAIPFEEIKKVWKI